MDTITAAWIAGLIEGEGTIALNSPGSIRLMVTMTDLDVLEMLQRKAGGTIYPTKKMKSHHKDCWRWSLYGSERVGELLKVIYPFMGQRRSREIEKCLEAYEIMKTKNMAIRRRFWNIKAALAKGDLSCRAIGRQFGVNWSYVSRIKKGVYDERPIALPKHTD